MELSEIFPLALVAGFYILIVLILSWIFSFNRKKRRDYSSPVHYIGYFCKHGHYMADKEPIPGTLCEKCIKQGFIGKGTCPEDSSHKCKLTRTTPPYTMECDIHGEFHITHWLVEGGSRRLSIEEWIEYYHYEPKPIPLPISKPIPLEEFSLASEQQKQEILKDRWRILYDKLQQRIQELEADMQRRKALQRRGMPAGIVILILLLLTTIFGPILSDNSSSQLFFNEGVGFSSLIRVLEQAEKLLTSLMVSCVTAAALSIVIIVLIKKRKHPNKSIDWYDLVGSISFALLIELLLTRFWANESLTIFDLLRSITLQSIPTLIFAFIYNSRYLKNDQELLGKQKAVKKQIREASSQLFWWKSSLLGPAFLAQG